MTFGNGVRIAPLSLYAIIKEVRGIKRFQLIQREHDRLELLLAAEDRENLFKKAKQAFGTYLRQNGVAAEVILSDQLPSDDPVSGKYKHIIVKK